MSFKFNDKKGVGFKKRLRKIRYLLLDVDGVLTDGKIYLDEQGKEFKVFNIYDGHGVSMLKKNGFGVGLLSGRKSKAVGVRSKELGISEVYQGISNKLKCYQGFLRKHKLEDEQVAYMGDDLIDIPIMKLVGFSVSVPNAVKEVKVFAHYITQKRGGEGAVREIADLLLKKHGKWKH
ncbi:MAG TPA: HAD hydrolase family protein [Nitrospiria bacterium]